MILYLHGGGYFAGSPDTHAGLIGALAYATGLGAVAPAYRLAPEHPAPAAFDDACAAHATLLARGYRPDDIVVAGDSAGGGLTLALLANLCARSLRPACAVAFSPWADLTLSSESVQANADADVLLPANRADDLVGYILGQGAGALSADDPRVSPVFADFDDPPPVLLLAGASELLRDDSVRMAEHLRAVGGQVALGIWPAVPHAWPLFGHRLPEATAAVDLAARFIQDRWP